MLQTIATHVGAAILGGTVAFVALAIVVASGTPQVVRCKHCKHSNIQRHTGDDVLTCWVHKSHGLAVAPDHFCGYGEVPDDLPA